MFIQGNTGREKTADGDDHDDEDEKGPADGQLHRQGGKSHTKRSTVKNYTR